MRDERFDEDAERQKADPLLTRVAGRITAAMEASGVTRAELARRLGTSRAHVSALLNGERNLTLRTLREIASALDMRLEVDLTPLPASPRHERNVQLPKGEIFEFCKRNRIRRLSLFGSVLRDDFGPESDIDVLVEFEPGHRLGFAFFGLQDELSDMLGRQVDLRTAKDLSRYFRDEVVRTAEVIYDAESARAA